MGQFDSTDQIILQKPDGTLVWLGEWSAVHEALFLATGALDFPVVGATTEDPPPGRIRFRYNATSGALEFVDENGTIFPIGGGGGSTFLVLSDTPGDYAGQAGQVVAVNAGETGLEFVPGGGSGGLGTVLNHETVDATAIGDGAINPLYSYTLPGGTLNDGDVLEITQPGTEGPGADGEEWFFYLDGALLLTGVTAQMGAKTLITGQIVKRADSGVDSAYWWLQFQDFDAITGLPVVGAEEFRSGFATVDWTTNTILSTAVRDAAINLGTSAAHNFLIIQIDVSGGGGGGGSADFIGLTDTPAAYAGSAGLFPRVNVAENALEFVAGGGGAATFLGLTDTPGSYAGQAGKVPVVVVGETAMEFVPLGAGGGGDALKNEWLLGSPLSYVSEVQAGADQVFYNRVYLPAGVTVSRGQIEATNITGGNAQVRVGLYSQTDPQEADYFAAAGMPNAQVAGSVLALVGTGSFTINYQVPYLVPVSGYYWTAFMRAAGGGQKRFRSTGGLNRFVTPRWEDLGFLGVLPNPATPNTPANGSPAVLTTTKV